MEYELKNSIKVQRAIKNITQGDLAEQLGVTRKTINAIENKLEFALFKSLSFEPKLAARFILLYSL